MINVNGETRNVEALGTMTEIVSDIVSIILTLYQIDRHNDPERAQAFKKLIKEQINAEKVWALVEN